MMDESQSKSVDTLEMDLKLTSTFKHFKIINNLHLILSI